MRYAFLAAHRPLFPVRAICHRLRIHPSGFCAWLKTPLSKRAKEGARQTALIRKAWVTDITYIRAPEGFAYLAGVIDLYSRRIVGWSLQSRQTTDIVSCRHC